MATSSQNESKSTNQTDQLICTYNAGETLFKEGTQNRDLFVVQEGKIGVFKKKYIENKAVGEKMIMTVEKGGVAGEMSLFDDSVTSETAKALEPSKIMVISRDQFQSVIQKVPVWFQSIVKIAVSRLKSAQKRACQSVLRDKKRAIVALIQLLYPVYKKRSNSEDILDYDFIIKEAYFVCRLKKNETKKIIEEFEKRDLIRIGNNAEKSSSVLVIPDLQVLGLYSEYLSLKSQNRKFVELSIPDDEIETLRDIVEAARISQQKIGETVEVDKEKLLDKRKDKKSVETTLIDLEIRSCIDIISKENHSIIVFKRKYLDRIEKIRSWIYRFEMELV